MSIKLQYCDIKIMIVRCSRYKFVVVYILYGVRIPTSVPFSCDPKRAWKKDCAKCVMLGGVLKHSPYRIQTTMNLYLEQLTII